MQNVFHNSFYCFYNRLIVIADGTIHYRYSFLYQYGFIETATKMHFVYSRSKIDLKRTG